MHPQMKRAALARDPSWKPYSHLPKLASEQLVDNTRIGLSPACFHHLPDQESNNRSLPALVLIDLFGVSGQHLIDDRLERTCVRDLLQTFTFHDGPSRLPALEHLG